MAVYCGWTSEIMISSGRLCHTELWLTSTLLYELTLTDITYPLIWLTRVQWMFHSDPSQQWCHLSYLTARPPPGLPPGSERPSAAAAARFLTSGHDGTAGSSHTSRRKHTPVSDGNTEQWTHHPGMLGSQRHKVWSDVHQQVETKIPAALQPWRKKNFTNKLTWQTFNVSAD